jgi:hypothetical protein
MTSVFEFLGELDTYDSLEATPVEKLRQAQAALRLSIGLAEQVAQETGNCNAISDLIVPLRVHVSDEPDSLLKEFSFEQWIEEVEGAHHV